MKILLAPDPILFLKAEPVVDFGFVKQYYEEMYSLMKEKNGMGLAAPQVGISQRFFIVGLSNPIVFINPKILEFSGRLKKMKEGCLSLPGIYVEITRPEKILISWFDLEGKQKKGTFTGLYGRCIQHENDHLDGKMIDYISS